LSENFRGQRSRSVEHNARNLEMPHSRNKSYDDLKVGSFPNDTLTKITFICLTYLNLELILSLDRIGYYLNFF